MSRYLTKSRFKVGYECPSKLFYLDKKEYGSTNLDNSFLAALAEGGFQVGELAKLYHPGGIEIQTYKKDEAAIQTSELLKRENVIIYEASIKFQNLFIKADVLIKHGNTIELIEVKAKSIDPTISNPFFKKGSVKKNKPQLNSEWEDYVMDIAFQSYVFSLAYPQFTLECFLMLADKTAFATVSGINQKFFLDKSVDGRVFVTVAPGTKKEDLGAKLLAKVRVDKEVEVARSSLFGQGISFEEYVSYLSNLLQKDAFAEPVVSGKCKACEFRIGQELKNKGLKSGFEKCWQQARGLKSDDFLKPFVFDVWNFRKSSILLAQEKTFMDEIERSDVDPREGVEGLSSSERQWLQIEKVIAKENTPFFDSEGLSEQMRSWRYPLHFIDFETTMVAIPFHIGRRPYEQVAFQFSHHVVQENGSITHADEYLNLEKGIFPNFDFLRNLKRALTKDTGTIFRYAAHENTVLCQIRDQLLSSKEEIPDKGDLIAFVESITTSTEATDQEWVGNRNMVDMCELVKLFYFHPLTKGSNSIKKVLPAILSESKRLQEIFCNAVYGSEEFGSKNYKNWAWVRFDDEGKVIDPYKVSGPSIPSHG